MINNKKILAASILSAVISMPFSAVASASGEDKAEFSLDEMIVTATTTPVDLMKTDAAVNVITREEIEEKHYQNLQEILEHIPGYHGFINANGVGFEVSNYTKPNMRGTSKTVVLVDGVKQAMNGRFYSAAAVRNVSDIERIEVIKGTASTLYGAEAIGGVINIITRSHYDAPKTRLSVSAGNFSTQNYQIDNYGEEGKSFWSFSAIKRDSGDYKDGNGRLRPQDVDMKELDLKYGYHLSDNSDLIVKYINHRQDNRYVEGRGGGYDVPGSGVFRYNIMTAILNTKAEDGKWANNLSFYRGSMFNNRALEAISFSEADKIDTGRNGYSPWTEKSRSITWSFADRYYNQLTKDHRLSAGIEFNNNSFEGMPTPYGSNPQGKFTLKEKSAYIQDEYSITDKLKFTAGVRFADADNAASRWLPSFDLGYSFSDKAMMYVSRKDYISYPQPYQIIGYGKYLPAIGLKPYTGTTNEIGAKFKFDSSTYFDIAWYDRRENDSITAVDVPGTDKKKYMNVENPVHYKGLEANLVKNFGEHVTATLGYTHLSCEKETLIGNMARESFSVDVKYKQKNYNIGISGMGRYDIARSSAIFGKYHRPDDAWVWNLYGNYQIDKNTKVWANVNNVFDKFYAFYPEWDKNFMEPRYYSKPGRSFLIGIEYTF